MAQFIPGQLLRQRSYRPADRPYLILSVSDAGLDLENETFPNGGTVYAETINAAKGKLEFGSEVSLYTNRFAVTLPAGQSNFTVDVSGKNGETPPKEGEGADLVHGAAAHNLRIYAENMSLAEIKAMNLRAVGGSGAEGTKGTTGGPGGNGKAGGNITLVLGTPLRQAIFVARGLLDSEFELPLNSGEAVRALDRRHQQVSLLCHLCDALWRSDLGVNVSLGQDSVTDSIRRDLCGWTTNLQALHSLPWALYPQDKETIITRNILSLLSAYLECLRTWVVRHCDVRGGFEGAGGQGIGNRGPNGTSGQNGKLDIYFNNILSGPTRALPLPLAHPDQCSMLLQLAKINYFQGRTMDARSQLTTLQNRLLWVHGVRSQDPIYRAYADAEPWMYLIPRPGLVEGKQLGSIEQLRAVLVESERLNRQLASQVDFYGHDPAYVPRGSYEFYLTLLGNLLKNLKIAEDAHALYFTADEAQRKEGEALKNIKDVTAESSKRAKATVSQAEAIMTAQGALARGLIGQMKTTAKELEAEIKLVEQKIANLTPSLGIDFMDLVEAATMLCFSPTAPMAITQAVGLGYKAYSKSGIKSDKGDTVSQDLLLEGFRTIESTTTSLVDALNDVKSKKSDLTVDDPRATKLLVNRSEMEKLLNGYTTALGKASLENVSSRFDAYINVTLRRNDAIMQYNNAANLWLKKHEEMSELDIQRTLAGEPRATQDPDLPAVAMFMEQSYNRMLWATMENLYLTERALRFWTLDDTPIIQPGLGNNPASNMTHATLSNISNDLLTAYSKAHEQRGIKPSHFNGIKVHLNPEGLKQLKSTGEAFLTIPPVESWTTTQENSFAGKCCVRLTKARFFLKFKDAPSADSRILVAVTHLGRETILDTAHTHHSFLHDQIYMHFKYPSNLADNPHSFKPGEYEDTIDADIGEKTNAEYALVGPFTTWRIQVPKELNDKGLNLDGVDDGFFHFEGMFYPLAPTPMPRP